MASILIYGIFLVAFFGNSLVGYNLIPPQATVVTEAFIYLLFAYSLIVRPPGKSSFRIHLLPIFLFFLVVAFASIIINDTFSFRPVYSLRLIFRFYIFYLALINLGLNEAQLKRINTLLFFLFIIQLPASAIKFYFYGVSEKTMGTYAVRGGGMTTVIPIVALGYLSAYYAHFKKSIWFVMLGVGYILFGIVGDKVGLLYLFPITFLGLYFLNFRKDKGKNIMSDVPSMIVVFLCIVVVSGALVKFSPRLNPEKDVGGSIDFDFALNYSKRKTTAMRYEDERFAGGRAATTKLALATLSDGSVGNMVLGFGPGALSKSILDENAFVDSRVYRVAGSYGKSGFVHILMEYGWAGVLCISAVFVVFIRLCWKWLCLEKDPYWKAFAYGSFVFSGYLFFIFASYNATPILGDTISPVFYYAMSVVFLRFNALKRTQLT